MVTDSGGGQTFSEGVQNKFQGVLYQKISSWGNQFWGVHFYCDSSLSLIYGGEVYSPTNLPSALCLVTLHHCGARATQIRSHTSY